MASELPISAHIKETGESTYAVAITVSGHSLKGDEPIASGGGNLGPSPYDLLLAALGECTAMTIRWYARQQNWPLENVEVHLSHQKIDRADKFEKQIIIHGPALTDAQRQKLLDISAKCPVQRTLESGSVIRTVA